MIYPGLPPITKDPSNPYCQRCPFLLQSDHCYGLVLNYATVRDLKGNGEMPFEVSDIDGIRHLNSVWRL